MNKVLFFAISFFTLAVISAVVLAHAAESPMTLGKIAVPIPSKGVKASPSPTTSYKQPPVSYSLQPSRFISQSFNNCGPASLSMVLSMFGKDVDQETLAKRMRPFHNPAGGVDDKSIFAEEFVTFAQEQGFQALERPNGTPELLKKLIANDIPVVVRTWLHPNEDIGHFRIVRGYNDETQTFIQDDSYQGPNLSYSYDEFLSMWQPFNYGYILVYPQEKQAIVDAILGEEIDSETAYKQSIIRAEKELSENPSAVYPVFNIASASYYLGKYDEAVTTYEKVADRLPSRMLWYQIEPIQAYQKTGNDAAVFSLTDRILNNGNMAYSELYQIRGEIYQKQGNLERARAEFEKAVYYNQNYQPAKDALKNLGK